MLSLVAWVVFTVLAVLAVADIVTKGGVRAILGESKDKLEE